MRPAVCAFRRYPFVHDVCIQFVFARPVCVSESCARACDAHNAPNRMCACLPVRVCVCDRINRLYTSTHMPVAGRALHDALAHPESGSRCTANWVLGTYIISLPIWHKHKGVSHYSREAFPRYSQDTHTCSLTRRHITYAHTRLMYARYARARIAFARSRVLFLPCWLVTCVRASFMRAAL